MVTIVQSANNPMEPMKTSRILRSALLATAGFFALLPLASGQDLYYDPALVSGSSWFGANNWGTSLGGPYNTNWTNGNNATWNNVAVKQYDIGNSTVSVAGMTNLGGANDVWITSASGGIVSFSGGNMTGRFIFIGTSNLSGSLNYTSGLLQWSSSGNFTGTMTNSGGSILPVQNMVSAGSNFIINSGSLTYQQSATFTNGGHVTVNGGELAVGTFSSGAISAEINSLQGSGGTVMPRLGSVTSIDTLIVNQSTNTTYSGNVAGVQTFSATTYLTLTKSGIGSLTFNGSTVNLREGTTVNGGTLLINGGVTRNFEHLSGSNAIIVADGGTFGGTSTLAIFGGDNVNVQDGGSLAAGNGVGLAGRTTFSFQSGGSLDLSAVTTETGWLAFDLGADTTAGTTYDQIRVTNGGLNIGTGLLNFNDFSFTTLAGFDVGTYTLFDLTGSASISGTLGASLVGIVGGYEGTVYQSGNNLLLDVSVIPEPSSALLALSGFAAASFFRRRRS